MLSNHCNVTGLLRLLQVNIQVFKIIKWTWRRPLKTGFAQISSRCPKNLSCPDFGGGCSPPCPPRPIRLSKTQLLMTSQTLELVLTLKLEKNIIYWHQSAESQKLFRVCQEGRGKLRYATLPKIISQKAKYSLDILKNGSCVLQLASRVFTLSFFDWRF